MELQLFDAHCHLDMMGRPETVASEAAAMGLGCFDCGVDPRDFAAAKKYVSRYPNIIAGVGLHPWWIADGRCGTAEVDLLCELATQERYIGEVGLDFSPRFAGTEGLQTQTFERLCQTLSQHSIPRCALSIHAVRSAETVLDILETNNLFNNRPDSPAIIFHWFSGTSDELNRARNVGCYFSINPRMLSTKRGRAYVQQIPEEKLLLESDLPPAAGAEFNAREVRALLEASLEHMAELRRCRLDSLKEKVAANSRALLEG